MILENLETEDLCFYFGVCVYTISCDLEWVEHRIYLFIYYRA